MAKKKKKNSTVVMARKGIAVLASVVTLIFMFLEMLVVKTKASESIFGSEGTESTGLKIFDFLFNEDYEYMREELGLDVAILWISIALVAISLIATVLAFVMKKGATVSKLGATALLLGMLVLFVLNFSSVEISIVLAKATVTISNLTGLYFAALGVSVVGFGAVITLED